ncbi:response regulator [Marinospirillum sp.]|uniref:response regulator n=1 Tax=Marinospirillum sp. TaxID=2183934 RepID=UPI003A8B2494
MKKIRLLTVDDAKFIRDLVQKTLRAEYPEFEIQEADNGRRAQSILKNQSFDLILCDWEMPEMSGLELLKWIRSNEDMQDQSFIMVTSLDQKENVVEALQAGVNNYVTKPFSAEQLISKIMKELMRSGKLTQAEVNSMGRKDRIASAGGAELLTGGLAVKSKPIKKGPREKGLLLLNAEQKYPMQIKDINPREITLQVTREASLQLGQPVLLGLMGGTEDAPLKVSVRAFVLSQQLAERNPRSEQQLIKAVFLKQDPEAAQKFDQLLNAPQG